MTRRARWWRRPPSTPRAGSPITATWARRWRRYANLAKVLGEYGLTMDSIVEEVVYVTDMDAAFAVAGAVRKQAYGGMPVVASTILVTPRLAFPDQLIEIKVIAKA